MKFIRLLSMFLIFWFCVIAVSSFADLAKWVSFGNEYVEYGFYVFMMVLFLNYIIRPWMGYVAKPTFEDYRRMFEGDEKQTLKLKKYIVKRLDDDKKNDLANLEDLHAIRIWIRTDLEGSIKEFNKITQSYAFKVSSAVLFSPNSFLDGITILYGNASMIYTLSKKVRIRYTVKDLWQMYFSVMTVASITGLIEEYDDFLIDMLEEMIEDIGEKMGEEAGKALTDAIPLVNIAAKTTSFLIQSAGNYAYIVYNGRRFKKMIQNVYADEVLSVDDINTEARREARLSRIGYVKKVSKGIADKAMNRKFPWNKTKE